MGDGEGGDARDEPEAFLGARGEGHLGARTTAGFYGEVYTKDLGRREAVRGAPRRGNKHGRSTKTMQLLKHTGASVQERGLLR